MVEDRLILQEAKRYNIKVPEETIRKKVEKEIVEKGLNESDEMDLANLIRYQMTLQELFQKKSGYSQEEKRRAAIDTYVLPMEIRAYYKKTYQGLYQGPSH